MFRKPRIIFKNSACQVLTLTFISYHFVTLTPIDLLINHHYRWKKYWWPQLRNYLIISTDYISHIVSMGVSTTHYFWYLRHINVTNSFVITTCTKKWSPNKKRKITRSKAPLPACCHLRLESLSPGDHWNARSHIDFQVTLWKPSLNRASLNTMFMLWRADLVCEPSGKGGDECNIR